MCCPHIDLDLDMVGRMILLILIIAIATLPCLGRTAQTWNRECIYYHILHTLRAHPILLHVG